jgi:short subunit dehydrogenase-like uncharacterized protein
MSDPILIYGATGYTGRLIIRELQRRGIEPVLAGRNAVRLSVLAEEFDLPFRAAPLHSPKELDSALGGVSVVLHAAGPFSGTARPMLDACLRVNAHYLDVTGEVGAIEAVRARDVEFRERGLMAMPGVGFDVVPSDCLAARVATRLPGATHLRIGITGLDFATRGSAKTLIEHAGRTVLVRRDGRLERVRPGSRVHTFNFGHGPRRTLGVSWGDVASAYYTTGIPNIEVYFEATPRLDAMVAAERWLGSLLRTAPAQVWLKAHADLLPEGPTDEEREAHQMVLVAEAEDATGQRVCSRLRTAEAYTLTATAAAAIVDRVLRGDLERGFQTPARVYGADFVMSLPGVSGDDASEAGGWQ